MPRYFFDTQNGYPTKDDDGVVLGRADAVPGKAIRTLFEVGLIEVMRDEGHEIAVTVRDEAGTEIYRTAMTVRGGWLPGDDEKA